MGDSVADVYTISKILAAIDGSDPSLRAGIYATMISGRFNAELRMIHVIHDTGFADPIDYGLYDLETTDEHKAIMQDMKEETKIWFDRIKSNADPDSLQLIKAELVGTSKSVDAAILDYAKRKSIGMIFIGTARRSGLKKLLVGSVASAVLSHSQCPVVIVK